MPKLRDQHDPQSSLSQQENSGSEDGTDVSEGGEFIPVKSRKKTRKGKKFICEGGHGKKCGKALGKRETSIQCEGCEGWFHPNCQGLSMEAFKAIGLHDLFWVCHTCQKSFKYARNLDRVVARVEQAEKNIIETINRDSSKAVTGRDLGEKLASMETKVVEKLSEHKQVILQSSDTIKKAMKENKEDREMNIIIHNVPESDAPEAEVRKESDTFQFQEMARALCGEDTHMEVEKVFRLGKKKEGSVKPRLLLVRLKKSAQLESLYRKRFKLTDVGFKNRYITRDLTPEERNRQKELREELKEKGKDTHKIFRNKVVPRGQ